MEIVLAVLPQSTAWFIRHLWDSRTILHSSEATAHNSNRSSSTTTLLLLRSSRWQLGQHSRSLHWGTRATTMERFGHFAKDCHQPRQDNSPRTPAQMVNQQRSQQRGLAPRSSCANYTTVEEIPTGEEELVGTFFLNERPIIILFNSGTSHDFMSYVCAERVKLTLVASGVLYVISTPEGRMYDNHIA
jgi:hypothetical protein